MNRYAMTVIDRCSGQNYTYYCKSQKEVPELFNKFLVDVKLDLERERECSTAERGETHMGTKRGQGGKQYPAG